MPSSVESSYWSKLIDLQMASAKRITIKKNFHGQMKQVKDLLSNDVTGLISTILEFMVHCGNVPFNFNTPNTKLTKVFNNWQKNLNKGVSRDIPRGLRSFTEQFLRERYTSSLIAVKMIWEKVDGFELPTIMYVYDGESIYVENKTKMLDGNVYYFGNPKSLTEKEKSKNNLTDDRNRNFIFRKPFNQVSCIYPTPYLVQRGTLYHGLFKQNMLNAQAEIIQSAFPYQLLGTVGSADAIKRGNGPSEEELKAIKDGFVDKKNKKDQHIYDKGLIGVFPGDVKFQELIPDYDRALNEKITNPIDRRILSSLGMIELKGFSSTREEAILNPKVLVEEVEDAVKDYVAFIQEIVDQIIERNRNLYTTNHVVEVEAGIVKAFLTDKAKEFIMRWYDRGQVSMEDGLENTTNLKFKTQVIKRDIEREENLEERMFCRTTQNLDNGLNDTTDNENVSDDKKPGSPESKNYNSAKTIKNNYEKLANKFANIIESQYKDEL